MKQQPLAKEPDLSSHLHEDWHMVHGIWTQIKDFIDRKVIPKQKAPAVDLTSSMTGNDTWYNFDFTSVTSPTASWAVLSVYFWHNDFGSPVMFGPAGTTSDDNATIRIPCLYQQNNGYGNGCMVLLPLDTNQIAAYCIRNYATKKIILLGYV